MNELIKREDAINAVAELQGIAQSKAELTGISKAWKRIKALPTVDAVQVVRCSKCVHFVEWTAYEKTHCGFQHDGMCKYWNYISTNKNSFCDHGLRITDGYCADGERD